MRLLIIGGTRFVGRHIVEAALARGHEVTLFHRGQTNADLFPQVEHLIGNRDGDLAPLRDRAWEAVIDTCGYVPRIVRQSAELLASTVAHYTFISTISVYAEDAPVGMDEDSPVATIADEAREDITEESYGALKVLCERVVHQTYADQALVVRPGLVVGPHDHTDRFTYWPHRIARGGEVIAPGDPGQAVQFIDARDLGGWIVRAVEGKLSGTYNATGPEYRLSMRQFLETCATVAQSEARLTWLPEEFLLNAKVEPWSQMPVWVPAKDAKFDTVNNDRAITAGLTYRPLRTTINDTLVWANARPIDHAWRSGLAPERERDLLAAWHNR
jgi:2'-hydroxyisoflavone reductase